MLSKAKYWMGIGKPKNQHSLENLKYLYGVLNKNQIVTENNKDLLIETLRSISEILIWGDQNDSSVFDFFLEKQMITFFLHYMKQKYGRFICVQLLQTLNILFENIRHETSLYFLLSNNHINNIILNKFDFSDEEVMAYYISFLKTLSLKLNTHSIHFFFNERASEFPLYVEALKFFDHPEAMVRIAVRTLTLNVFRVPVQSLQKFVKDKTSICYFSNLVWLVKNHVLDLDVCVKNTTDHTKKCRLTDLIDEYIDHLNYLQDIYILNIQSLSNTLTEQLIRRLFVPVYLSSILKKDKFIIKDRRPIIQSLVAIFLLSHVFSVITYVPLLNDLCELIFYIYDEKKFDQMCSKTPGGQDFLAEPMPLLQWLSSLNVTSKRSTFKSKSRSHSVPHFNHIKNHEAETASNTETSRPNDETTDAPAHNENETNAHDGDDESSSGAGESMNEHDEHENKSQSSLVGAAEPTETNKLETLVQPLKDAKIDQNQLENITDDEKRRKLNVKSSINGVVLEALLQFLNYQEYDELNSLTILSFLYTLLNNSGVPTKFHDLLKVKLNKNNEVVHSYNEQLMNKLIGIISKSVEPEFKVRLATLDLATKIIKCLAVVNGKSYISDFHLACIEQAREQSSFILRRYFKTEEMFLDMFEHEYHEINSHQIHFELILRDWSILLTPTSTPLSGIEFTRRFPCGDTEKLKHSIRVFFLLRNLCLSLTNEIENQLPLTKQELLVKENDALDLNSSDLIACTVNLKEKRDRRFLVIDPIQFILVEPEVKRIGWGIVKFSDLIQDVEVCPDKEDSRSLNIKIKKANVYGKPEIVLNSVFTFDDHIRCMAAKQHLTKARDRARRMKLEKIAQLLDLASCSNNNQPKSMSNSSSSGDILSYNMVAGFNMFNTLNHPGRASIISSTWSQITQHEKMNPMVNSPINVLTTSPLIRNPSGSNSNSSALFYKNQFISPNSSSKLAPGTNEPIKPFQKETSPMSNDYSNNDPSNDSDKTRRDSDKKFDFTQTSLERRRSSNHESPPVSPLIHTNLDDTETVLSKIQILPPSQSNSLASSLNQSKDNSNSNSSVTNLTNPLVVNKLNLDKEDVI